MLEKAVFSHVLSYRGEDGLRGAMEAWEEETTMVELEDQGVLLDTNTQGDYESVLQYENCLLYTSSSAR